MSIFIDLSAQIRNRIKQEGPISVYDFMKHALQTAEAGYYTGQTSILGTTGDFTTAPEISQLFGEIIGLWCLNIWHLNGCPKKFNLIELGPGNGTLMKDLLRATKNAKAFHKALKIYFVEINNNFIEKQKKQINHHSIEWVPSYDHVPKGFSILVANEFFDALPINQYTKKKENWQINMVDLNADKQHLYINQLDASADRKSVV